MPLDPSGGFLQKMLGSLGPQKPQAPPMGTGIQGPMPAAQPLLPSWMKTGFEGGMEGILGALGIGGDPNSKMNQVGQLGMAALPVFGGMKAITNPARLLGSSIPESGPGMKPILDEAGRFLGFEPEVDPVFAQHVASSVGKFKAQPNQPLTPNFTTPNVPMAPAPTGGRYEKLAPNVDQLEQLMSKYRK